MKIRQEQIEDLRAQAVADFERRAIEHLRTQLAELTSPCSDAALLTRVRSCMERAARYGFTTQKQIICFVDITYFLCEKFDVDPHHADIVGLMRSEQIEPTERAGLALGIAYSRYRSQNPGDEKP